MRKLILAPHPDDELIACHSVLGEETIVIYLFSNEKRQIEAVNFRKEWQGKIVFCKSLNEIWNYCLEGEIKEIYIPSPMDINLEHKWLSEYIKRGLIRRGILKKGYYYSYQYLLPRKKDCWTKGVDLLEKEKLLKKYYPSQYEEIKECGIFNTMDDYEEFEKV